ncbi:regulator of G-protein signaling 21-like [Amphibalanus amphitrite]|uniref:regulator of G-protein signaling 21-like n=1 Tax=Amphibalanus amphitrite TaxID=1232801 RepID=UPI001C9031D1|nr:regulator of G-protein signaling 21-like [Amphibalanus amphitrite]
MKTLEMWKRVVAKLAAKQLSLSPRGGLLGPLYRRRSETPKITKQQQQQLQQQQQQARLWASSLATLLSSKQGLSLFRSFLVQEFSEENLDFWLAVEEYKQAKHLNLTASAHQIYDEFVAPTAPRQVNVDSKTRTAVKEGLSSPTTELFDRAQRRVQILMENDTYGRFLLSAPYLALVDGKELPQGVRS